VHGTVENNWALLAAVSAVSFGGALIYALAGETSAAIPAYFVAASVVLSTRFRPDTRLDRGGHDVGSHGGSDGRRSAGFALRRAGRSPGGRPGGALERASQAGGGLGVAAR